MRCGGVKVTPLNLLSERILLQRGLVLLVIVMYSGLYSVLNCFIRGVQNEHT